MYSSAAARVWWRSLRDVLLRGSPWRGGASARSASTASASGAAEEAAAAPKKIPRHPARPGVVFSNFNASSEVRRLYQTVEELRTKDLNLMAETEVKTVTFGQDVITTTVTSSGRAVERWIAEVLSVYRPGGIGYDVIAGLNVEWRPSFSSAKKPTATLQLCVDRRCLVFQLLHADFFPAALDRFLGDRTIRFFGVGVAADAGRLRADHGLEVANAVDLRARVAEHMDRAGLRQAGLRAIAGAFLGADPAKPRDEQISYACIDAFVASEVARKLQRDQ